MNATATNPIDQLFQKLRQSGQKALMPFLTAGDPALLLTPVLLDLFAQHGCHLCELGFPYSDPIADGPTIQASFTRALGQGIRTQQIFETVRHWREQRSNGGAANGEPQPTLPVVAMLSYAIVFRQGIVPFVTQAANAGFSGLIVPDLPSEECDELHQACRAAGISLIQLITPTTDRQRIPEILARASGFIYYVSVAGVTGTRSELPTNLIENLAWLKQQTSLPICVGFGISGPEQVRAIAPYADGLIVGSAIVKRIEQAWQTAPGDLKNLQRTVGNFIEELLGGFASARGAEATSAS